MLKVLLTATVQSHICQFHKPLVRMLRRHGDVEIHVAARDNLAEKNGLKLDFADKVFDLPFSRSPKSPDNIRAARELKRLIREEHYDIIHCNTPVGGVVTRLVAAGARRQGARVIYTAHGFHFYQGSSKKSWTLLFPIEKRMSRRNDILITINEEDYALARESFPCRVEHIHGVGVDAERYHTVPDTEAAGLKEELGYSPGQRLILSVGELLPNKNHVMAVRAMRIVTDRFPEAKLLIAGNGPEKERLEEEITALELENNVELLGYCTHLEDYQRICDLSVACSRREGLPLNVIEAMLSGNPVIAAHNRGHDELIRDGENGFLINHDDAEALAGHICRLLSDDDLRRRLAANAPGSVSLYTASSVEKELEQIYFGG